MTVLRKMKDSYEVTFVSLSHTAPVLYLKLKKDDFPTVSYENREVTHEKNDHYKYFFIDTTYFMMV